MPLLVEAAESSERERSWLACSALRVIFAAWAVAPSTVASISRAISPPAVCVRCHERRVRRRWRTSSAEQKSSTRKTTKLPTIVASQGRAARNAPSAGGAVGGQGGGKEGV